eukprot:11173184-Lingulodinium_polyedra.AAC.1
MSATSQKSLKLLKGPKRPWQVVWRCVATSRFQRRDGGHVEARRAEVLAAALEVQRGPQTPGGA